MTQPDAQHCHASGRPPRLTRWSDGTSPVARKAGPGWRRLVLAVLISSHLSGAAAAQPLPSAEPAPTTTMTAPAPSPTPGATVAPGAVEPPVSAAASLLPRDLSPWGMFQSAHIVVKMVMSALALASLLTWTVALAKSLEILAGRRRLRAAVRALAHARSLIEAGSLPEIGPCLGEPVEAVLVEIRLSADTVDKDGIKERIASRLERIEATAGRVMMRGTGMLATIGATAPFIGLFGTVWGIMNSFIGISQQHTTNLAVVAPGIAEALLATALGLAAAIPAVVIYNMFSRSIVEYRALYADATAAILRIASRDLDRLGRSVPARGGASLAASRP